MFNPAEKIHELSWKFMKYDEKMYQYFMIFHEFSWKFTNVHENDSTLCVQALCEFSLIKLFMKKCVILTWWTFMKFHEDSS